MPNKNMYSGYVKLPGKNLIETEVRLDFNSQVSEEAGLTKITGFNLRLFTLSPTSEMGMGLQPEMSVSMTTEQWIDLIDSMREELNQADKIRKTLEDIDNTEL